MGDRKSFEDRCIISCGMLYPELRYLMGTGFLNPFKIMFTPPGLHAKPDELERQLIRRLKRDKELCPPHKIIVVYGRKCYVNVDEPTKRVDSIIESQGEGIRRVQGDYGYDMLAGIEERERISGGEADKILWFTPDGSRTGRRSIRDISAGTKPTRTRTSRGFTQEDNRPGWHRGVREIHQRTSREDTGAFPGMFLSCPASNLICWRLKRWSRSSPSSRGRSAGSKGSAWIPI
ncbi:DUF1638 domain-containing protein [Candidatus Poribacteria bacterium]|nr:DUF1638 domain-containing protein [Candidatus Poribacteria bacterium]